MFKLEISSSMDNLFDTKIIDNKFSLSMRVPKKEVDDWIKFHSMNIKCDVVLLTLSPISDDKDYPRAYFESFIDVSLSLFIIISKIILYFNTEEDRNLFRLTWI